MVEATVKRAISIFESTSARSLLLAAALACAPSADAQIAQIELPEILTDQNGVEITSGLLQLKQPVLSFGEGIEPRVDFEGKYPWAPGYFVGDIKTLISSGTNPVNRGFMGNCCGQEVENAMTPSGIASWYNYTLDEVSTGTGIYFKKPAGGVFNVPYYNGPYTNPSRINLGIVNGRGDTLTVDPSSGGNATSYWTKANGEKWTIRTQYNTWGSRLRSISTNRGFFIQYEYEREAAATSSSHLLSWRTVKKISAASLAHAYCDTTSTALCANATNEGNYATIDYTDGAKITHASGAETKYKITGAGNLEVTSPNTNMLLTASKVLADNCNSENVTQVVSAGSTWSYQYTCTPEDRGISWWLVRTDPSGGQMQASGTSWESAPSLYQDEVAGLHGFGISPALGYSGYSAPEGNTVELVRDARMNVVEVARTSKDNLTIQSAYKAGGFPTLCGNFRTCNQPSWTRDGNGNQTDYTYDATHGGVLTETGPADSNGVRPQKRYEYAQRYAWLKNSSGTYSQAASPIWVKTKEEYCISSAASSGNCAAGASDEVVTEYDYGPNSGPNNLLIRGVAVTAGGQTLRTCYGYDRMGRKVSETKPAANLTSCP